MIYLALLKRFWPLLVGAVVLLSIYGWHRGAVKDAYREGVRVTEEAQAEVIARVRLENEKRERDMAVFVQSKQLELQVKDNANRVLADDVKRLAGESRLCLNQVRRSAAAQDPGPTGASNGPAERPHAAENMGEITTGIIAECQRSTDKLIVLQGWAKSVLE